MSSTTTAKNTTLKCTTQNQLLMQNLLSFYQRDNNLEKMLNIINGETSISLRIVDWFTTNYAKKYYTVYLKEGENERFKVYVDYKLKLRSYSKKRFDPFCRWDRIHIPYKNGTHIQTTIGQLNFFKWALENHVIAYIDENYAAIEKDMNTRNSTAKRKLTLEATTTTTTSNSSNSSASSTTSSSSLSTTTKTRKKREELSISATKTIKKENVEIVVRFG
jgi:hypothetical protein